MHAQRTAKQAYRHVLAAIDAGTINPIKMGGKTGLTCSYSRAGLNCSVGALLSPAQLADIKRRGLNSKSLNAVVSAVGVDNLVAATGLNYQELRELQNRHDRAAWPGTATSSNWSVKTRAAAFRAYVANKAA